MTRWSFGLLAACLLGRMPSSERTFSFTVPSLISSARFHSSPNSLSPSSRLEVKFGKLRPEIHRGHFAREPIPAAKPPPGSAKTEPPNRFATSSHGRELSMFAAFAAAECAAGSAAHRIGCVSLEPLAQSAPSNNRNHGLLCPRVSPDQRRSRNWSSETAACSRMPFRVPGLSGLCWGTTTVRASRRKIKCEPVCRCTKKTPIAARSAQPQLH
jgi:hypothetical protein